jgi:hypothetical protein
LTLGISENTSIIDIDSGTNINILSYIIENNYDDNDDEENDISLDHLTGLETREDYTEDSDILDNGFEIEEPQRTYNTLLVTDRTERHHSVETLNDIEMFDYLSAYEGRLKPDDELAEDILFSSKAVLIWIINDWSVKKNVQCWTQDSSKIKLIMKCKVWDCLMRLLISLNYISCAIRIFISKTVHFMLIVKNLFSFYVKFEILLYFLLFCRLWNVNKDVNMRNDVWNEMHRTYMKKSSENHFWTRITDRNYQITDHNNEICSLVRSVKKVQKLRTAILKCRTVIIGAGSANLQF